MEEAIHRRDWGLAFAVLVRRRNGWESTPTHMKIRHLAMGELVAGEHHEAHGHLLFCSLEISFDDAVPQRCDAILGAHEIGVDVEVECSEKGVRCECTRVEYVGSSLDKVKHDGDSVRKVVAKANTARESIVLAWR